VDIAARNVGGSLVANLTIKGLTKKYNNETIGVEGLNLEVEDKEFLVLVGPSGCGKTTVLNSIAGLIEVNEGEIWFGDELVSSPKQNIFKIPQERGVAMVFQDYAIYPHMTVYSNMSFPLEIRKIDRKEIEKRVKKAAHLLGIGHLLDRRPKALSGGQRQRIAIGRAIVRNPKIFLMDEPLANLDAKLRVSARVELKKLQKELGVTTVFVTHDQIEAMTMGDRIAIMNKGCVEQIGTPVGLYHKPKNLFVAGFIGSPAMNMFEGKLIKKEDIMEVHLKFLLYKFSPKMSAAIIKNKHSSQVILGVRPEDVLINKKQQENSFQAKIIRIEPIGKEYNIHLEINGSTFISIQSSINDLEEENIVWISFNKEKIYLFNLESGEILF